MSRPSSHDAGRSVTSARGRERIADAVRAGAAFVWSRWYLRYPLVLGSLVGYAWLVAKESLPVESTVVPAIVAVPVAVHLLSPVDYTRRGWAVVGIAAVGAMLAWLHGSRHLDALLVPLVLALGAATVSVLVIRRPKYRRIVPENDHAGERRTVGISFNVHSPQAGVVDDEVGDGLSSPDTPVEATIDDDPVEYRVDYERRGVRTLGPLTVTVEDVLGLAEKSFEYPEVDRVVVYPRVRPLTGVTRHELNLLAGGSPEREREEFHRLREYVTGDSLRDVHWKSSARQPDDELVVKEFVADDRFDDVRIVAEAPESRADDLAEAVASVAVHLLNRGIEVGVTVADGSIPPSIGPDHRARLLELLARTDAGEVDGADRMDADVVIEVDHRGVAIRSGDYETTFEELRGSTPSDHAVESTAVPEEVAG